ncbi:hypothetical protein ILYODFUR_038748 [Ilyodon furcidens]|uniref:Uncharacterized protein n=1 Tax=Ilyodon furcidens TaxID=33524 RepID=A0ABV0T4X1_9TELE
MCFWMNASPKERRKQARRNVCGEEDEEGNPLRKRSKMEEERKRPSSTDTPTDTCASMDPSCAPSTSEQCVTGTVQDIGSLIREVQNLLGPAENCRI